MSSQTQALPSAPAHKSLKERAREEFIRFVIMFLYLWLLFSMFHIHEYLVLAKVELSYFKFGVSLINALVFAKVMLLADNIKVGAWMRTQALIVPILARAFGFAVLFIVAHVIETMIERAFSHEQVVEGVPSYGGGLIGAVATAVIIAISLIPFLAFEELDLALGAGTMRALLLTPRPAQPKVQAAVEALQEATRES